MFWRIFIRSVSLRWRRLALASVAMLAGTGAVAALVNLSFGMRHRMSQEVQAFGPSAVILPGEPGLMSGTGLLPGASPMTDEAAKRIETVLTEASATYAPLLYVLGRVGDSDAVVVGSMWPALFRLHPGWNVWSYHPSFNPEAKLPADLARTIGGIPALIGVEIREALGVKGLSLSFAGGRETRLVVVGAIETGAEEDAQIFIPLDLLQDSAGRPGAVSAIAVRLPGPGADVNRLAEEVSAAAPGWTMSSISQVARAEGALLHRLEALLLLAGVAILIGSALAVMSTMLATVMEREKEIGLMRALGGGSSLIWKQLLLEGVLVGLAGAVGGLLLGWGGSWGIARVAFGTGVALSAWTIPLTLGVGIGAAAAAVILPLRRALRIDPARALRG
ncbi:MAG: ABC transporter permease [Planctomycetota bacterium]|nr:ABC transporter permease [Planctomycetota bacterium]